MNSVVYKYRITIIDYFSIQLPFNSLVLRAEYQRGEPYIWVLQENENELEEYRFHLYGTGSLIHDDNIMHISTFMNEDKSLVWHLFQEI